MKLLRFWLNRAKDRFALVNTLGICGALSMMLVSPAVVSDAHEHSNVESASAVTEKSRDDSQPHISVELISKSETFNADGSITVGVKFTPEKHWHIYWLNPGDTGLAPEINWKLPPGYSASSIAWPYPKTFPIAHLTNYGYENTVLLSTTIKADENFIKGEPIHIEADLSWLVCEEACIPGESSLSLPIRGTEELTASSASIADRSISDRTALFDFWDRKVPQFTQNIGSKVNIDAKQKILDLSLYAPALLFKKAKSVEVFVKDLDIVRYGKPLQVDWGNNWLKWRQQLSEYFTKFPDSLDIVVVVDGEKSYEFSLAI